MVESQAPTKEIIGWLGGPLSHCHCWVSSEGLGMQKAAGFACAKHSVWNCESQADRRGACSVKPGLMSTLQTDKPMGTTQGLWEPGPGPPCHWGRGVSSLALEPGLKWGCFPELPGAREELMEVPKLPALLQGEEFTLKGMSTLHCRFPSRQLKPRAQTCSALSLQGTEQAGSRHPLYGSTSWALGYQER